MMVAEETIKAAVLLEEVFADCSERTAFLVSENEIPRSTFICCTFFYNFHLGHSREKAEWSPLQLTHLWWLLQWLPHGQLPHISHTKLIALASSRAIAVLLTIEATQTVLDVWLHRDPQVTGG